MFRNFNILLKEVYNQITSVKSVCVNTNTPKRLLWNSSTKIDYFSSSEKLYRRCKRSLLNDPFGKVSLLDLSHNRSGVSKGRFSKEEDVFLDSSSKDSTIYEGEESILLSISIFLDSNKNLTKKLPSPKDPLKSVDLVLKHRPIGCNFYHTCIEFYIDGIEVTGDNYKKTLGKNSNRVLREQCRHTLADIIVKEQIFQTN